MMATTQLNKKNINRNLRREITTGEAVENAIALSKEEGPIWEYNIEKTTSSRKTVRKSGACVHVQK